MKVSYYELLGMIKEGNIPERIKVSLVGDKEVIYTTHFGIEGRLVCYMIENEDKQDENYHYYLTESLIEYNMFDKCIEIIEEEKEIEKLRIQRTWQDEFRNEPLLRYIYKEDMKDIENKINELIDEIKKLKENL